MKHSSGNGGNLTKNPLEWAVFGVSSVLVMAVIGLLVAAAIHSRDEPAKVTAHVGRPVVADGWVRIPVTVKNEGQRVAANVEITVMARLGEEVREGGFTTDYVPRGGAVEGTVSFRGDRAPAETRCEVIGYEEP